MLNNVMMEVGLGHYLFVAAAIFVIGMLTVLLRRNVIVMLMGIELMLNAVNLTIVSFSHYSHNVNGQILAFFVMTIAAAEAGVGLALAVTVYKKFKDVKISFFEHLRG